MGYAVGVLVFVVGMVVSIALHEVGHMLPAKRFGVRVSQFMVGFGSTIRSWTRGETEYGFKWIPLGGYVRLVGMYAPARPPAEGRAPRRGRFEEMAADAREVSAEEIRPGEEARAFYNLSAPKKLIVMLGGPVMNLLIAAVLLGIVTLGWGTASATSTLAAVVPCAPATTAVTDSCAAGAPGSPAAAAGLEPGDRILEYGGEPVDGWTELTDQIAAVGSRPTVVTIERAGQRMTLDLTPVDLTRTVVDAAGAPVRGSDGSDATVTSTYVGIQPTIDRSRSLAPVPSQLWAQVSGTASIVVTLPGQVWDVGRTLVTGGERSAESVMSIVGVGRVAGEVGTMGGDEVGIGDRVAVWLSLLASLNIALFVFNLVPLLPLDGGHVVGALYEGARRQIARLRGRPDPGPADTARMMPVAYGVFVLLVGMSVLLIVADVIRPVTIG
ncbi:M50 family metallopeptidase [Sanguibacter sp. A247]|uniref:M50 family metallopeptidase n=1 Tax=unclassified Sanguibacter TaxID=2645534 RepID=UPI003FD843AD